MGLEIDIRQFLVVALGANELIHPDIDAIYEANKFEYYEEYRKSNYFNDPVFSIYTTLKQEKMKRVAGIIQWDYHNQTDEHIMKLIKKGYNFPYRYVNQHAEINIQSFSLSLMKRYKEDMPEMELFRAIIIAIYLSIKQKKKYTLPGELGDMVRQSMTEQLTIGFMDEVVYREERMERYRKQLDALYAEFHIPKNKKISADTLFETIIRKEIEAQGSLHQAPNYLELRHKSFQNGISKYIGAYSGWVKTLGIHASDITESAILTPREIDKVFMNYIVSSKDNNISEKDKGPFIIGCLYILVIGKEYEATKKEYFNDLTERYYDDIISTRSALEAEKETMQKKSFVLDTEKRALQADKKRLKSELGVMEKERDQYKKQVEQQEDNTKELLALRELAYSLQIENDLPEEGDALQEAMEVLKEKSCAIIGGHPNWRNKMKNELPHFVFVDVDEKGRSLAFLDKMDAVILVASHANHSMGKRVVTQVSKNNAAFHYLNDTTNIEKSIMQIYNFFAQSNSEK